MIYNIFRTSVEGGGSNRGRREGPRHHKQSSIIDHRPHSNRAVARDILYLKFRGRGI